MKHCPDCNAELAGSGFICAACGWGTGDSRQGADVQPGMKITAGATAATRPIKQARDGAYDFGAADPVRIAESELHRAPTMRDRQFIAEPYTIVIRRDQAGRVSVNVPHQIVHRSPDGFEYGYGGSGPADLALNILAAFVPTPEAFRLHQHLKCQIIARLDMDVPQHRIDGRALRKWIETQWSAGD